MNRTSSAQEAAPSLCALLTHSVLSPLELGARWCGKARPLESGGGASVVLLDINMHDPLANRQKVSGLLSFSGDFNC